MRPPSVGSSRLTEGVSIHAPQEGCDRKGMVTISDLSKFQFTHPGRGATRSCRPSPTGWRRFNSRTPGGVRPDSPSPSMISSNCFNSRTPGGVRLPSGRATALGIGGFNSRTPGGVRQLYASELRKSFLSFNSRTPGGVRPPKRSRPGTRLLFQFTHPGRGATLAELMEAIGRGVSIHAPREGCDLLLSL